MKSILTINIIFGKNKEEKIIKQGIYKDVKYEIHKGSNSIRWYLEFNETYNKYYTPLDFEHLEKDFDPEFQGERIFSISKDIPLLWDCFSVPEHKYHMISLDDIMYEKEIKPMDQIMQDIKNSIDELLKYQKTALKLVEYENKYHIKNQEFHKSISKQEEKHKKDIQILNKEYEVYLK